MNNIFLFPGQGSQKQGMGSGFSFSEEIWKEADKILGFELSSIVATGDAAALGETRVTQPAIYVTEVIILKELISKGIRPQAAAGHSLGEYAALVAVGSLSWEEGLELVRFRGEVFEKVGAENPGGMLAVIGLKPAGVEEVLLSYEGASIANYNSPGQDVVSAPKSQLEDLGKSLKAAGAKLVVPLKVSGGFHSALFKDAIPPMREKMDSLNFLDPEIPFYSNNTASALLSGEEIKESLLRQVTSPVRWVELINSLSKDFGENLRMIEAGPGKVLQGLMRRIDRTITSTGVSEPGDIEKL